MKPLSEMTRVELEREVQQLRDLVVDADFVSRARFGYCGLCDSIDNCGKPYPSQWASDVIERAKQTSTVARSLLRHVG